MLYACPNCGKPISDSALMCPHCKKSFASKEDCKDYSKLSQCEKDNLLQEFMKEKPSFKADKENLSKGNRSVKILGTLFMILVFVTIAVVSLNLYKIISFGVVESIFIYLGLSAIICWIILKLYFVNSNQKTLQQKMIQYEIDFRDWLKRKGYNAK